MPYVSTLYNLLFVSMTLSFLPYSFVASFHLFCLHFVMHEPTQIFPTLRIYEENRLSENCSYMNLLISLFNLVAREVTNSCIICR